MKKILISLLFAAFVITGQAQKAQSILLKADSLNKKGNYVEVIALLRNNENIFAQENLLSYMYGSLSYCYLFTKDYKLAEQTAQKGLETDSTQIWIKSNIAHALLFQGKIAEAEKIYDKLANTIYRDKDTYAAALLDDFEQLEKAGIIPVSSKNDLEKIKTNITQINEEIKIYKQFYNLYLSEKYDEAVMLIQPHIYKLPKQYTIWASNGIGNIGINYYDAGDYVQAEKYYLEAKDIREKVLGKEHPDYANSLNNLGNLYIHLGNYAQAEKYLLEAKNIWEKTLGKEHIDYASSLNNLGAIYKDIGDYTQAEKYYLEANNILEKMLGKEHPDYARSLNNLGDLYVAIGNYAQAEKYLLEAKNIREKVLGKEHPDYALSLNNLGNLLKDMGEHAQAEKYFIEAKNIWGKTLGKEHPNFALALNNLGALYDDRGDYVQAEKYYLEAKNIREKVLGKEHPDYANSLNNLGSLYIHLGDYAQAEKYYLEAKNIKEKVLGKEHPNFALALNNLGMLYSLLGDYAQAEKYYLEAKNIREKVLGKEHPDYAGSLNDLGWLYSQLGDYAQAEKYYLEAKNIKEKVLGKEHPDYAITLNNLGMLYCQLIDLVQAEKYLLEAKNINEKVLGKEHPDHARSLNNLGLLYDILGDYKQAEKYYLEAKNIWEKALGKDHPDYNISINNLFYFSQDIRDYEKAAVYDEETCGLIAKFTNKNFAFLSEQQRNQYWATQENTHTYIASYSLNYYDPTPAINSLNYNNTLFTKGLLLRTTNGIRDAIYSSGNKELISQYEQLGNLRQEIRTLQQKTDYKKDYVQTLENSADSLDKALTQASTAFRDLKADMAMTWQDVQKQLKPDEAAIEFVDFRLYNKNWTDSTMYAALVLRPGMSSPEWIPLCEQKQLDAILQATIQNTQLQTENLYDTKGEKLFNTIWKPLEQALQGVKTVYYSPSGLLYKIAFSALPTDEDNILLSDKYNLNLVSSTREVVQLKKETNVPITQDTTVIYGGLTYDVQQSAMLAAAKPYIQQGTSTDDSSDRNSKRASELELPSMALRDGLKEWPYLAGTKSETEQIVKSLSAKHISYQYYTGDKGNEESFKHLSGTKTGVIHLSTHGFFLSDIEDKVQKDFMQRLGGNKEKPFENPLLRSGLIMSGANNQWLAKDYIMQDGIEDGILTADEIAQLNLTKTKLVVLSACETGLGDVKNSEGVFGLQRAFKLAGVESLIMSLWKVPDEATADLMTTFYQQWLSGQSKQNAFKTAQQKVREKYQSPFYWAAFVMMD